MSRPYQLYTDGGARGNPGPSGIGVVLISPDGEVVEEVARGIGLATNNVAEYRALIEGLETARAHRVKTLEVLMDSMLVIEQMKGNFKVKSAGLKPLHVRARELVEGFETIKFSAIPRAENQRADRLSNEGMDALEAADLGLPAAGD